MRKRDHKEAEVTVTMKGVVEKDQVTTASKILAASVVSIGLACTVLMYFFEVSHGGNTWKTGDWLINYSSGFIRRGAFGEVALFLSHISGFDLLWTVFTLQFLLLFLVFFLVVVIFFRTDRSRVELMIFLSPAFLLFPFYDIQGGFRKEILVYIPFLIYVLYLLKGRLPQHGIFLVLAFYAFALFSHELAVFVLPFFIIVTILFFYLKIIEARPMYVLAASFVILAGIALIFSSIFLGIGKASAICNHLVSNGLDSKICDGAINCLEQNSYDGMLWVANIFFQNDYLATYIFALILSLLPFYFLKSVDIPEKYVYAFPTIALLFMLPLYVFAVDWGRWIHIYIFFLSVLVFALADMGYLKPRIKLPIILILPYVLLWNIPHCCHTGLKIGAANYFKKILFEVASIFV
ncbi:MAG TPA: hypothetical protein PL090_00350 [Syntrophales bacterium]|nr:hypothetical protein [Syntrophales bacterium]